MPCRARFEATSAYHVVAGMCMVHMYWLRCCSIEMPSGSSCIAAQLFAFQHQLQHCKKAHQKPSNSSPMMAAHLTLQYVHHPHAAVCRFLKSLCTAGDEPLCTAIAGRPTLLACFVFTLLHALCKAKLIVTFYCQVGKASVALHCKLQHLVL